MTRTFVLLSAIFLAGTPAAMAQSFPGGPLNPGDNGTAGATNTVAVTGVPSLTGMNIQVSVTFAADGLGGAGLGHTWVGDVILRLTGPNATQINLIERAGKFAAAMGDGDSSNLIGTFRFIDTATLRLIDDAKLGASAYNVTPGAYRATNNTFNGNGDPTFTGEVEQTLNTSFGTVGNGNWTLFYSDNAVNDYAAIEAWNISFVPVPEPALTLLGAGGLAGLVATYPRRYRHRPA